MSERPDRTGPSPATALAAELAVALGHGFRDPELLRRALTHASCNQAAPAATARRGSAGGRDDYDRLEFLGDRVLALVITERLFARYPDADAGELARRLNALVRQESLAGVARAVPLGPHIAMSPDMREAGGAENPSILADVCEAVIAALYLDGGMAAARDFILPRFEPLLDRAPTDRKDAKTRLQEWAAGRGHPMPVYQDRRSGPAHAPVFAVTVQIPGLAQSEAEGEGRSKRAAQQMAAAAALKRLDA